MCSKKTNGKGKKFQFSENELIQIFNKELKNERIESLPKYEQSN